MRNQPRIMFMTHMDTVPLCAGAKPKLAGRRIVNQAKTALGGDNRAGCGVLVTLAAELAKQKLDHPPITLLFCVREESGLWGARHVRTTDLGSPVMAFNYDGGSASNVTIGAVGADRWQVEIFGRASHAGVAPERGISSTMILALALADVKAGGWFGKVVKGKRQGTSNVGPVTGGDGRPAGDATNVVTDYVNVRGESRSHDSKFFKEITRAYKVAFEKAAKRVKNSDGKSGRVKFKAETDYYPFRMKDSLPVVKRAVAAVSSIGETPTIRSANGGLDANWMVRHGVPTVTFGAAIGRSFALDLVADRYYELNPLLFKTVFELLGAADADRRRAQSDIAAWTRSPGRILSVAARFPLDQTAAAHQEVERGGKIGTVIVEHWKEAPHAFQRSRCM